MSDLSLPPSPKRFVDHTSPHSGGWQIWRGSLPSIAMTQTTFSQRCHLVVLLLCLLLQGTAKADSVVVFNEIMYHPLTNESALEWIELHNQNAVDVDLSGWRLTQGIDYIFPAGTV